MSEDIFCDHGQIPSRCVSCRAQMNSSDKDDQIKALQDEVKALNEEKKKAYLCAAEWQDFHGELEHKLESSVPREEIERLIEYPHLAHVEGIIGRKKVVLIGDLRKLLQPKGESDGNK